ncbi:MAG: TIGR02266 family protein [Sorangiineae bacterium]|nr:TIGR02266 family protein [Polyangiaceae bacterium]MEB2322921.1 TIGR02266 family protein [Sorangiineae bacterium]
MDSRGPVPSNSVRSARHAREQLADALGALQRLEAASPRGLGAIISETAAASSALYEVEAGIANSMEGVADAIERLGGVLATLQRAGQGDPALFATAETVARTLALLYPVARIHQRRERREVVLPDLAAAGGERTSTIPPAPEATGRPRQPTPFDGSDKRARGQRVFVETDIGLSSESNFYTGLSQDLSTGGVFIATYHPKPPGTPISLFFALPDGHAVNAEGIVRWTRAASPDAPPGMGVQFQHLSETDLAAIERFCRERAPLYFDTDEP